jgi:hypothetical protein
MAIEAVSLVREGQKGNAEVRGVAMMKGKELTH